MLNRNAWQAPWALTMLLGSSTLLGCQPAGNSNAAKGPEEISNAGTADPEGTTEDPASKDAGPETKGAPSKRLAIFQYADSPLHDYGVRGIVEGLEAEGFVADRNLELSLLRTYPKT